MDSSSGFDAAIEELVWSDDFRVQRDLGHQLICGAALTSVSDVPFEIRCKCALCGLVLWFENPAWADRAHAQWQLAAQSLEHTFSICPQAKSADSETGARPLMRS